MAIYRPFFFTMARVVSDSMRTIEGFDVFPFFLKKKEFLGSLAAIFSSAQSDLSLMLHVRGFSNVLDLRKILEYVLENDALDLTTTPRLGIDVITTGLGSIFFWCCVPFVVE